MLYNRKEKERDSLVLNWNKPLSKTKGGPNSPNQDLRKLFTEKTGDAYYNVILTMIHFLRIGGQNHHLIKNTTNEPPHSSNPLN